MAYSRGMDRIELRQAAQERAGTEGEFQRQRMAWYAAIKSKPCADCGHTFPPYCMDFHHALGDKKFSISKKWLTPDMGLLEAELAKCELLCANCHRIREHEVWKQGGPGRGRRGASI